MSDPSLDPPVPPPVESPTTAFLQRAAPIIAAERGLTPRARLLLESLSKDMSLSSHDFEEAIAFLQKGEAIAAQAVDPQRARFRELLKRQLRELPAKIVSARHEQTLVAFAVSKLALEEQSARDDIQEVSAELGLRRVPFEQAIAYVDDVVGQKLGDSLTIDLVSRARLLSLGRDWGLDPADVEQLIQDRLADNAAVKQRERMWNVGLIAGSAGAIGLVLLVLLVISVQRYRTSDPKEPTGITHGGGNGSPVDSPTPKRIRLPDWWDTDLTLAATQARDNDAGFAPIYQAITSPEAQRRSQGYELLNGKAASPPFDYRVWRPLEAVIVGSYALEPDAAAAETLRRSWIGVVDAVLDKAPASPDGYQAAIRPVNTAVRAMKDRRTPPGRVEALADDLGARLKTVLARETPEATLQREALAALSAILLEQLAAELPTRPELLTRHYPTLHALGRDRLAPEDQARLDAAIAAAAIDHAPQSWRSWEAMLNRGIESPEPLAVLRIVDAFERSRHEELRRAIAPRLFARLGISPTGLSSEEYGAAMRKALGVSATEAMSDETRWARLRPRAEVALAAARGASADDAALLRTLADLAWHTNLAMALAGERADAAQFDRWLEEGLPSERKPTEEEEAGTTTFPMSATPEGLPRDVQGTFDRYIRELGDWQKLDVPRRVSYLRLIAQVSPRVADISPPQARQIAAYLVGRKADDEQAQVLESCTPLRNWKQLRLALADAIERSPLSAFHLQQLVVAFTARDVAGIESDRSIARRLLLQSVLVELQMADADKLSDEQMHSIDRSAEQLTVLYAQRAQLLGALPAERDAARGASALLRLAVQRLGATAAAPDERARRLETLAAELGTSDVQQAVVVQRALVDGANSDLARRMPARRSEGETLVGEFRRRSAAAPSALAQLVDGEATLLQLWLLHR
jgi:hypothetical protein